MKLTAVLLTAICLHASAAGRSQQVTLRVKNVPLEQALSSLQAQTGYLFIYSEKILQYARPVSANLQAVPLTEALDAVLKDTRLRYNFDGRFVTLTAGPEQGSLSESLLMEVPPFFPVKGQVKSTDGQPLAGATIGIAGAGAKTVTDAQGNFEINGKEGDRIVVSFVGYENYEVRISGNTFLNIVLKPVLQDFETVTVVNTGYQTLSRERSTGAFSKPDMKVVQNRSGTMNLLERLDGQIPGLTLNKGIQADYFPVSVRGLTTINGASSPLYVVDGMVVQTLNGINPADVADVTVLKDATAASIWGARAANGVIVITTKKGTGSSLRVDYDMFYSFQGKPDIDVFPRLNSREYIQTVQDLYNMPGYLEAGVSDWTTITAPDLNNGQNFILPHEYMLYNQPSWMPAYYEGKTLADLASMDNIAQMKKEWYRNALLTNHTISVSANTDKYGIYASLGYTGQKSATPGSADNTYLLNARQDFRFAPGLQVYLITNLTYTTTSAKRAIAPDGRFVPYAAFTDDNGKGLDMSWLYRGDSLRTAYEEQSTGLPDLGKLDLTYNPSREFNSGYTKETDLNSRLLAGITLKLAKGLRFEGVYGGTLGNGQTQRYDAVTGYTSQLEIAKMTVAGPPVRSYVPTTGGKRSLVSDNQKSWTIRNQLVYDNRWQEGTHQLTLLAGTEFQQQIMGMSTSTVRGYDEYLLTSKSIDYTTVSAGIANTIINTSATFKINDQYAETFDDTRFRSYYANAAYTWRHNYTLNASTRFDESNLFGKDVSAQAKPVWSVGGSWRLSSEPFMEEAKWIDHLSLRVTYGITGNSPAPGSGGSYDILAPGFAWGVPTGSVNAVQIETPGNSLLSWEKTNNLNAGIDFSLLHGRLSGGLDYYYKHTTNLLGDVPQNAFTGYDFVYGNAGVINNKGIELSLATVNIKSKSFEWHSRLNLAYNKGKVAALYSATILKDAAALIKPLSAAYYSPARMGLMEGFPPFTLFAYRYAGLNSIGDPQVYLADGSVTADPGVPHISDLAAMGSVQPQVTGGFSNSLFYRHFSLDINMVYSLGFVIRRDVNELYTGRITTTSFTQGGIHEDFLHRWKKPGDEAVTDIPAYDPATGRAARTDLNYYTAADINVIKGDYIKLRDITLAYELPVNLVSRIRAQAVSFRLQLNNVMVWKANKYGIDPEFYNGMGSIMPASERGSYVTGARRIPVNQHSVTIGAHITF